MTRNIKFPVITALLGVLLVLFAGTAFAGEEEKPAIRVDGEATVEVKPDRAEFTLAVITEGKDAQKVQEKNAARADTVVKALQENGIAEKDITTSIYYLSPKYTQPSRPEPVKGVSASRSISVSEQGGSASASRNISEPANAKKIAGYKAIHRMEVKVNNLEELGKIIDTAVQNGASQVSNLRFTLSNGLQYKKQALQKAVADARDRAQTLASSLGVKIAGIKSANGSWLSSAPRPFRYDGDMQEAGKAAPTVTSIAPGTVEIRARASIEYYVN